MPVFPAHRTLSQAKYMALLRWLMVRQSLSMLSDRCIALLAASTASTEFPRRSTVGHKHTSATVLRLWCLETNSNKSVAASLTLSRQAHVCFQLTDCFMEFSRCPALLQSVAQQGASILSGPVRAEHMLITLTRGQFHKGGSS